MNAVQGVLTVVRTCIIGIERKEKMTLKEIKENCWTMFNQKKNHPELLGIYLDNVYGIILALAEAVEQQDKRLAAIEKRLAKKRGEK